MDGTTAGIVRKIQRREVIDKWWFVDSDVHAEPEMLARNLAQVLMREEEEAIISTILAAAPPVEVRAKTMNDELPDWLTSMENHSLIVTNSWDAYYELIPGKQFTFANDDVLKTASGTPVLRLYDNRSPFVAAFLTPLAIRCKLSPRRDELLTPNGFVIDNTILVSVRELNESDLMALATDSGTSQNDYRAKALIEASEELTVEVDDSSYIKVWTLKTEDE